MEITINNVIVCVSMFDNVISVVCASLVVSLTLFIVSSFQLFCHLSEFMPRATVFKY